jgi:acetylornithine deacetylase/succinyl-diaminopimelate desuccinylase-like protein
MVMLLLKRTNARLARDVIFVAESGEEGFAAEGFRYLVENHWPEIEAEFALAEGGGGRLQNGKPRYLAVAATEKVGRGVRLVARGSSGHGSVPRPDNAVARLARAVARAAEWQPPMRLNDITRTYFERLASISPPEQARRYREIPIPEKAPEIERYFREHEPAHNSMLRTSISPTIIRGGFRGNVIPSEAEAYLDIRALPEEDMDRFYAMLREAIGDPQVEVAVPQRRRAAAPGSRIDTEMFRAIEAAQRRVYPGAITLPALLTGATDMAPLRAKGVQAYGVGPFLEESDVLKHGAHSDDERLAEESLYKFVEFLWHSVIEVSAP